MPQPHQQADHRSHVVHDVILFHRFSSAFHSRFSFASSYSEQIEEIDQQDDKLYRTQKYLKLSGSLPADEGTEVMQSVEQYAGEKTAAFSENQGKYHPVDQGEADLENCFPQFCTASYVQEMAEPE